MYTTARCSRREVPTAEGGPRKPLAGAGVGGRYWTDVLGSGLGVPGVCNQGPTHEKRVHEAKQCQIVPNSARMCLVS